MTKNIQNELFEKTNTLKKIEPQIIEYNKKKKLHMLPPVPLLVAGVTGTVITGSFIPVAFCGFISLGFMASSAFFQFKENNLKSQFEITHNEIQSLRELELANSFSKDNHALRQFKKF